MRATLRARRSTSTMGRGVSRESRVVASDTGAGVGPGWGRGGAETMRGPGASLRGRAVTSGGVARASAHGLLEARAGLERRHLARLHLDRRTRLRVARGAGAARTALERAEAGDDDLVALLDGLR